MKRLIFTVIIIIFAGFSFYFYISNDKTTYTAPAVGITAGKTAPAFTLPSLSGVNVKIDAANDKKIFVLNFWTTWCPPCREEMPELQKFYEQYGDKVQFYGIDEQEPPDKVKTFLQSKGYTYPILLDENQQAGELFKINAIPTTIITDINGIILFRKSGGVTADELKDTLAKAELE